MECFPCLQLHSVVAGPSLHTFVCQPSGLRKQELGSNCENNSHLMMGPYPFLYRPEVDGTDDNSIHISLPPLSLLLPHSPLCRISLCVHVRACAAMPMRLSGFV
jgi:hypothetical protein